MTNPVLSIKTNEQIGRVYQMPDGVYAPSITPREARRGLQEGSLFPSITNVISALNPRMEGYQTFMTRKALQDGEQRESALNAYIVYRDFAGARGTRVHKFIEDFIEAGYADENYFTFMAHKNWRSLESFQACDDNDAEWNDKVYLKAFFNFIKDYNPRFIHQEATVYGTTLSGKRYAGTTDFIAEIDGKIIVGDWKTSSKMSSTVALQLSAVIFADKMTTDFTTLVDVPHIDEAWGIHLDKKTQTYGVYKAIDPEQAFVQFSAARELWNIYSGSISTIEKI